MKEELMALSPILQEAATSFGRALAQTPAVTGYRAASEALNADLAAQALLAELREQQAAVARLQQAGLAPSQTQLEKLRLTQAAVRANETIMRYLRATNEVKAFLPSAAAQVSSTLGADYGSLVRPETC
jgi:cell fate (sporulation/competence/biofilm development) regulator YlbF (YheA/YmcA/DUF963 family)